MFLSSGDESEFDSSLLEPPKHPQSGQGTLDSGGSGSQQSEQVTWEGPPERGEEHGAPEGCDVHGPVGLSDIL